MITTHCCSRRDKDVMMEENESGAEAETKKLETLILYSFLL